MSAHESEPSPAPTNLHAPNGAEPKLASIYGALQAEEAPSPARARLAAIAAQVNRELFGDPDRVGRGELEEAGLVPVG